MESRRTEERNLGRWIGILACLSAALRVLSGCAVLCCGLLCRMVSQRLIGGRGGSDSDSGSTQVVRYVDSSDSAVT